MFLSGILDISGSQVSRCLGWRNKLRSVSCVSSIRVTSFSALLQRCDERLRLTYVQIETANQWITLGNHLIFKDLSPAKPFVWQACKILFLDGYVSLHLHRSVDVGFVVDCGYRVGFAAGGAVRRRRLFTHCRVLELFMERKGVAVIHHPGKRVVVKKNVNNKCVASIHKEKFD